jgi:hypothetical protein
MACVGSLIGLKGNKWQPIAAGPANEIRDEFKHGDFKGFARVVYLDTGGGTKRKKGQPAAVSKAKAKKSSE